CCASRRHPRARAMSCAVELPVPDVAARTRRIGPATRRAPARCAAGRAEVYPAHAAPTRRWAPAADVRNVAFLKPSVMDVAFLKFAEATPRGLPPRRVSSTATWTTGSW